jgi:hypothetical protein
MDIRLPLSVLWDVVRCGVRELLLFYDLSALTNGNVVHRHFLWSRSRAGGYNYIVTFLCAIA